MRSWPLESERRQAELVRGTEGRTDVLEGVGRGQEASKV